MWARFLWRFPYLEGSQGVPCDLWDLLSQQPVFPRACGSSTAAEHFGVVGVVFGGDWDTPDGTGVRDYIVSARMLRRTHAY